MASYLKIAAVKYDHSPIDRRLSPINLYLKLFMTNI